MKFRAEINVMPHKALLDPQGKAVSLSMPSIGLAEIGEVRIGKHITLEVEAASKDEARFLHKTSILWMPISTSTNPQWFVP